MYPSRFEKYAVNQEYLAKLEKAQQDLENLKRQFNSDFVGKMNEYNELLDDTLSKAKKLDAYYASKGKPGGFSKLLGNFRKFNFKL